MNHAKPGSHTAPRLATPTDLGANAAKDITGALNALLADTFALYMKTKNFHWHMSGPHFRDYHLLLDEQSDQIFAVTDVIAERVRKLGQPTLRSIGEISRQQRIADNDAPYVDADDMLAELRDDNQRFVRAARGARRVRGAQRRRHRQPVGELYRRGRAAGVVPLRVRPPGRAERALARDVGYSQVRRKWPGPPRHDRF